MNNQIRDFDAWLSAFKPAICSYDYYVDFDKVLNSVQGYKAELCLLDSLLGSKNIEDDFLELINRYPNVLNVIPILIAKRESEILVFEAGVLTHFNFGKKIANSPQEYAVFMRSTGLFELMENHVISNLVDYVTGVEVGLDSNARKNRGGHLMENHVESFLEAAGLSKRFSDGKKTPNVDPSETGIFFKEFYTSQIQTLWGIDLSPITNNGTAEKRFDFVVRTRSGIYGIETNFYTGGGSKLNETARSYKEIALESRLINGFDFVWITDGAGWKTAKNNLRETFEVMDHIYNLEELAEGKFKELFR